MLAMPETSFGDAWKENSAAQPAVALVTMAESVALLQEGAAQRLVNQLLIGSTTDVFPAVAMGMREDGLKHAAAPGFVAMAAKALVQPAESLDMSLILG